MTISVGVFCGASEGNNPAYVAEATRFGEQLAMQGYKLVYGAGGKGIMGAVSKGALGMGGKVHGVIPRDMFEREWARTDLTQLSTVSDIHERKKRLYKLSSVIVTLPGGFGTLDEFFESVTWSQLGYHDEPKPTYVLNVAGYYDELMRMIYKAHNSEFTGANDIELVKFASSVDELMAALATHT